ncbi:hypothetical protein K435DRAFT_962421 [Dendrothele bispora CBS 962.96]|uniref:Transmembrane protein n=1 Tax=Dendrothele bispora (strain CBS 962.96) TaxID=1314807 RepID=A0A4S8MLQ1_DENBC|nr:hypothetical protein K435DRAFT_962421 [Dendrothele bispora CBS 962.96]
MSTPDRDIPVTSSDGPALETHSSFQPDLVVLHTPPTETNEPTHLTAIKAKPPPPPKPPLSTRVRRAVKTTVFVTLGIVCFPVTVPLGCCFYWITKDVDFN